MDLEKAFAYIKANEKRLVDELVEFLRIPSISAHKEHDADVARALEYDKKKLESLGFKTEVWPTRAHAGLFAERIAGPDLPTVLIYGHVDVQPVDPIELWDSPPFEPRIHDGKIWARGADDNKGQHYAQIAGVEAALKGGGELPVNVKFIIESDEEYDGEAMAVELPKHAKKLACDVFVVSDSDFPDNDHPAVTLSLRGIQAVEITITGASGDKHSGQWGGMLYEPIDVLRWVLQNLKDFQTGRVLVPGFYDDVLPPTAETRGAIAQRPWNDATIAKQQGVSKLFHEEGYTALESGTLRPTLQVNGIWGGLHRRGIQDRHREQGPGQDQHAARPQPGPREDLPAFRAACARSGGRHGGGGIQAIRRRAALLVRRQKPVRSSGTSRSGGRLWEAGRHAGDGRLDPHCAAAGQGDRGALRHDGIRPADRQPARPQRALPHRELSGGSPGRRGLFERGRDPGGGRRTGVADGVTFLYPAAVVGIQKR